MNYEIEEFLTFRDKPSEERELLSLSSLIEDLIDKDCQHSVGQSKNFYEELTTRIRSLIYSFVLEKSNSICSSVHKYCYLLYKLYQSLSNVSFTNPNFLVNFLFKRIFLFQNMLNSEECNNIMVINDNIINLCNEEKKPIIYHCINLIVNIFIFDGTNKLSEIDYLMKYLQDNEGFVNLSSIKSEIATIYFQQLICLDDFANDKYKKILKDENKLKEFIEAKIDELFKLNLEKEEIISNENENGIEIDEDNDKKLQNILFLFYNDFNKETTHLLRNLYKAIINVFAPIDSNILDFFEVNINSYCYKQKYFYNDINTKNEGIKLDVLEKLFLDNNIQDVDIKIRNMMTIKIIIIKYWK